MKEKNKKKKSFLPLVLAAAAVLILGLAAEYACNFRELSLSHEERQMRQIPMDQVSYEGFHQEDGHLVFDQERGVIRVDLGGSYVKKLGYSLDYEGLLSLDAHVAVVNANGQTLESEELHIEDHNSKLVKESWLNISRKADHVNLIVKQEDLQTKGLEYIDFSQYKLIFTGFYVNNMPSLNPVRLLFFWCVFGIAAFLCAAGCLPRGPFARGGLSPARLIGNRVETGFLVIALSAGIVMIAAIPATKAGWDEEIHFERAFWLSSYPHPSQVSSAVLQEFTAGIDTWPSHQPDGMEEQRQLDAYLDASCDYDHGQHAWGIPTEKTSFQGYLGSAAALRLGRLLHLPFSLLFRLGRLGNLLVYCLLMFFAIKNTPVGKGIMAFIGLMPTPLFLACVYSYDPMITGCLYLAFALLLRELLEDKKTVSVRRCLLAMAIFYIGCRAKAVYAPLILLGLLIPGELYDSKKQKLLVRAGFILVFALLLLSFVLPTVTAPSQTGDIRGGDTSVAGQMTYLLGRPLVYAWVLIRSIWSTMPDYLLGNGVFGLLGHLGNSRFLWLIYVGAVLVIVTNNQSTSVKTLDFWQKLWMFLLSGASAVLVWTSMYMAFTPPGAVQIAGVQGRYYLPFLCLVYLSFTSRKVVVHISPDRYYTAVLGLASVILLSTVYGSILAPYCL